MAAGYFGLPRAIGCGGRRRIAPRRIGMETAMLNLSSVKTAAAIAFTAALGASLAGFPLLFDALGWATP